ncbi:MAG: serine--tRNA ligase [Elusimicrobiota bacterium]
MLNIEDIRKDHKKIIKSLSRRGNDYSKIVKKLKDLDSEWRKLLQKSQSMKSEKNDASDQIGKLKREGKSAKDKIDRMKKLSEEIKEIDEKEGNIKEEIDSILMNLPNLPDENIKKEDRVIRQEGEKKSFDFEPKAHWDIGEMLDIIDFKTASKLSGSRFPLLKDEGAELERALINFMLDIHKNKFGYREVMPPYLVKKEIMEGTGQLPKFIEDMYETREDGMFLIPTAEVPLVNMVRKEILDKDELPKKYVAYTPCFRREAGSYGKDTRGLIRNHQFNKVELVNIVLPEQSEKYHKQLLTESEEVLKQLGLTYRILKLGTEEMGFAASQTYDIEVWMPGEKKWREISSCSNCRDFQARRMMTRYRTGGETDFVHTLNSSGVAVGRLFAAVLENLQTDRVNVKIPKNLRKYVSNKKFIKRKEEK